MTDDDNAPVTIAGLRILLRDASASDLESYSRWMRAGEWRQFDAPWERENLPQKDAEIAAQFERCYLGELPTPRKRLIVALPDSQPIGWVIRYDEKRFPSTWNIGINICEDTHLGQGLGTEALKLWIDYLFANSEIHRIAFATYSFNARVIRLAEKLGFTFEGREREIVNWQGAWHDRLHFSVLRREWEVNDTAKP